MVELSLHTINKWDDDALQMLYRGFYKALVVYAASIVGDSENAEDIVQDTFTKMWQKRPSFKNEGQLKVYLYTATHNQSISYLRHSSREGSKVSLPSVGNEVMMLADNGEEQLFGPEVYRRLMMMVEKLPTRQREVFLMAMDGKKNKEIASQLDISLNTVKVLKGRALQTLKQNLDAKSMFLCYFLLFA